MRRELVASDNSKDIAAGPEWCSSEFRGKLQEFLNQQVVQYSAARKVSGQHVVVVVGVVCPSLYDPWYSYSPLMHIHTSTLSFCGQLSDRTLRFYEQQERSIPVVPALPS